MTDRILIPLVNGDWLALDEDQFTGVPSAAGAAH